MDKICMYICKKIIPLQILAIYYLLQFQRRHTAAYESYLYSKYQLDNCSVETKDSQVTVTVTTGKEVRMQMHGYTIVCIRFEMSTGNLRNLRRIYLKNCVVLNEWTTTKNHLHPPHPQKRVVYVHGGGKSLI